MSTWIWLLLLFHLIWAWLIACKMAADKVARKNVINNIQDYMHVFTNRHFSRFRNHRMIFWIVVSLFWELVVIVNLVTLTLYLIANRKYDRITVCEEECGGKFKETKERNIFSPFAEEYVDAICDKCGTSFKFHYGYGERDLAYYNEQGRTINQPCLFMIETPQIIKFRESFWGRLIDS